MHQCNVFALKYNNNYEQHFDSNVNVLKFDIKGNLFLKLWKSQLEY